VKASKLYRLAAYGVVLVLGELLLADLPEGRVQTLTLHSPLREKCECQMS
jgi:hypothetical protein